MDEGQETDVVFKYFAKLEAAAEDILADKELLIKLDAKRNSMREAMRGLQSQNKGNSANTKTWMCIGDMFVKVPIEKALAHVIEEQKSVDEEVRNLRNNLKLKVDFLRDLEGQPGINPGFRLNPLSRADMEVLGL